MPTSVRDQRPQLIEPSGTKPSHNPLYRHRWPTDRTDQLPLPALDSTAPAPRRLDHAATSEALDKARARHLATQPLDELRALREEAGTALDPPASGPAIAADRVRGAEFAVHQLATQQRAAQAQHLALATLPRTSPDRIETARLAERSAAINLAQARQSLAAARQLGAAASGDPAARTEVESILNRIDTAIDRKIIDAVRDPAPNLIAALGPRPPRSDPRRERWNHAASHLETYRHKTLGISPADGPRPGAGVQIAIGRKPIDIPLLRRWQRAAKAAHEASPHERQLRPQVRRIT